MIQGVPICNGFCIRPKRTTDEQKVGEKKKDGTDRERDNKKKENLDETKKERTETLNEKVYDTKLQNVLDSLQNNHC